MGTKLPMEKASWTLVEQGVVSPGKFSLNMPLAHTLGAKDYGEFVLFLGAIFLLGTVDHSLISIRCHCACVASDEERRNLLGNTIVLSVRLRVVLAAVMAIGTSTSTTASGRWDQSHPGASTRAAGRAAVT
jgi:hypothetical protein